MDQPVNVAVVRAGDRRAAVAQALALLGPDLRKVVTPRVLLKPNLVSHRNQLPSTHADALSATLDALFAHGASEVTIAEGASDATAGFARFGYRRETFGRPVRFLDLNREETRWGTVELTGTEGETRQARVSETIATADCRVSLALAKTHVTSMVTLCLKNMLSSLHPDDRVMMHGHAGGGNGYKGWKRAVVEFLKGDSLAVNALTRAMGRVKNLRSRLQGRHLPDAWRRLNAAEIGYLKSVDAMNRNLVALSRCVGPHLGIVDGFVGMHREGPRHGTPIHLGVVIAGSDPVAVDAVSAAVMGFDPRKVGYIRYAEAAGLGKADLDAINILGDPIAAVRRRCVPHSNDVVQRHWPTLAELTNPATARPHVRPARTRRAAPR